MTGLHAAGWLGAVLAMVGACARTGGAPGASSAPALEQRCQRGHAVACYDLAALNERGRGVRRDVVRALSLYALACDLGDPAGCHRLATLLEKGDDVPEDQARARVIYRRGCDAGSSSSCSNLGVIYAKGEGVDADATLARDLFGRGCALGDPLACMNGDHLDRGDRLLVKQYCDPDVPAPCR